MGQGGLTWVALLSGDIIKALSNRKQGRMPCVKIL
jgi:hypothetical protein